jgi:hypothetical protein
MLVQHRWKRSHGAEMLASKYRCLLVGSYSGKSCFSASPGGGQGTAVKEGSHGHRFVPVPSKAVVRHILHRSVLLLPDAESGAVWELISMVPSFGSGSRVQLISAVVSNDMVWLSVEMRRSHRTFVLLTSHEKIGTGPRWNSGRDGGGSPSIVGSAAAGWWGRGASNVIQPTKDHRQSKDRVSGVASHCIR